MFRAFYRPASGSYKEDFQDFDTLDKVTSGAILVIKINEDGTREIVHNEKDNRKLTEKEDKWHRFALRHLEFKYDGGDTPEMQLERMRGRQ